MCLLGLEAVLRDGEYVGHLRRGDHAHYLQKEIGYGYVARPDGEKVTPSWLKEGNYQIESRGRKYEVGFDQQFYFIYHTDLPQM